MNRSCNSILCRFGIHTADPYVHIQVLDKIERETKLNPRHIHDLIDLLEIALEVL